MTQASEMRGSQAALSFEYELDAPPAQVWRALTVPEFVAQWLARPVAPGDEAPAPEGATPPSSPAVSLRLQEAEPGRYVRYSWSEGEGDPALDSVVTFRLRANDSGGTTFSILHELKATIHAATRGKAANSNAPPLLLAA
jgi:uncharacterized protein YndB with AHSA1/START domain